MLYKWILERSKVAWNSRYLITVRHGADPTDTQTGGRSDRDGIIIRAYSGRDCGTRVSQAIEGCQDLRHCTNAGVPTTVSASRCNRPNTRAPCSLPHIICTVSRKDNQPSGSTTLPSHEKNGGHKTAAKRSEGLRGPTRHQGLAPQTSVKHRARGPPRETRFPDQRFEPEEADRGAVFRVLRQRHMFLLLTVGRTNYSFVVNTVLCRPRT